MGPRFGFAPPALPQLWPERERRALRIVGLTALFCLIMGFVAGRLLARAAMDV
jgi:hypothetical protein